MEKTKKINWFDFKKSKISGSAYLVRMIVGNLLIVLVIPGIWLIASTVYKRSRSFEWTTETSMVIAIFAAIMAPINFALNQVQDVNAFFMVLSLLWMVLHLILLFKNGNLKQPVDSIKETELNENAVVEKLEIDLDDENVNSEITADDNKIESNEMKFKTDIDSNWLEGGEKPPAEEKNKNQEEDTLIGDSQSREDLKSQFEEKIDEAFLEFEKAMNSENHKDYPVPYWYDIVKTRAEMMKSDTNNHTPIEVQHEWTWSHADEYKDKYQSVSKTEAIEEISIRIQRYGFIYDKLRALEEEVLSLCKNSGLKTDRFENEHQWNLLSAAASLYGSINYALSIDMSNSDILELYPSYVYDQKLIEGVDPFLKFGQTREETEKLIKDKLGLDMNDISLPRSKINKKLTSILADLPIEKRYAIFFALVAIAQSDGITKEEDVKLSDAIFELDIEADKFNNYGMDGNTACDLLQGFNQEQKDEFSRLITEVVGADGEFSSDEMLYVMDFIKEADLDPELIGELIKKYW